MRLEQLQFVKEVADTKSMSVAAGNLFVTPQYISKAIKQLEDEVGVMLFQRSKNGVWLTLQGEKYYETIKEILTKIDELTIAAQDGEAFSEAYYLSELHILASPSLGCYLLPTYQEVINANPAVELQLFTAEAFEVMQLAESHKADIIAVTQEKGDIRFCENISESFDAYVLCEDNLCLWTSKANETNWSDEITLKQLMMLPMISYTNLKMNKSYWENTLQRKGIKVNTVIRSNNLYECAAITAAVNGYLLESHLLGGRAFGMMGDKLRPVLLKEKIPLVHRLFVNKTLRRDMTVKGLLQKLERDFADTFRMI